MGDTFELEAELFVNRFSGFIGKRIILYGIGRRTATLLEKNKQFNFIGLMDRDPDNLGKIMYGLPILDLEEAEKKGDMIIINTPQTYWEIIYKRIRGSNIPVYFLNGQKAMIMEKEVFMDHVYWNENFHKLRDKLLQYDGVTFDIFDTLVVRRIMRQQDVFEIIDNILHEEGLIGEEYHFTEMRNMAINRIKDNTYTFYELYHKFQEMYCLSDDCIKKMQHIEIETEKSLLIARKKMVELYNEITALGKTVFVISDMYLPKELLADLLLYCGVKISLNQIIVSCEVKCEKSDGGLWEYFKQNVAVGKKYIHVGNDQLADVIMPKKYGVDSYYIMGVSDMMQNSSISKCQELVIDVMDSVLVGTIACELFNDPFSLCKTKGQVYIDDLDMWGYCIWGNIVFTFLEWLAVVSRNMNINELLFLARDGYLLLQDYKYYADLQKKEQLPVGKYLYISRRAAYIASIKDEKDFQNWLCFPYIGNFKEFLLDRCSVSIQDGDIHSEELVQMPQDKDKILIWMEPYRNLVKENLQKERKCYEAYLKSVNIDSDCAIVDMGFYGNTQYQLGKILKRELKGLYFNCYLGSDSECCHYNVMVPCFQSDDDPKAEMANLHQCPQLLESVFTAPYGMILRIDENGDKVCAKDGCNQKFFNKRILINEGIQRYMTELLNLKNQWIVSKIDEKGKFADDLFGILNKNCRLDEKMCEGFVWDDAVVQRRENPIFT